MIITLSAENKDTALLNLEELAVLLPQGQSYKFVLKNGFTFTLPINLDDYQRIQSAWESILASSE